MEKELQYSVEDPEDFSTDKWTETLRFLVELETGHGMELLHKEDGSDKAASRGETG